MLDSLWFFPLSTVGLVCLLLLRRQDFKRSMLPFLFSLKSCWTKQCFTGLYCHVMSYCSNRRLNWFGCMNRAGGAVMDVDVTVMKASFPCRRFFPPNFGPRCANHSLKGTKRYLENFKIPHPRFPYIIHSVNENLTSRLKPEYNYFLK